MRLIMLIITNLLAFALFAQDNIALENPSFEGAPQPGAVPQGWENCGPPDETPPDIHPNDLPPYHFFGVKLRPYDGYTYVGMVVRDKGTREAMAQRLATPLEAGRRYMFSLFLARSDNFWSGAFNEINFSRPAILRIWGGSDACGTEELLALTVPVSNTEWQDFAFTLEPTQNWTHLTFEAYYEEGQPYNGHVLMDFCSDIAPLPALLTAAEAAAMDDAALEAAVLETAQKYWDIGIVADFTGQPMVGVCYYTWLFERAVAEQGLRKYVLNTPFNDLSAMIRALEAIRGGKNLDLLKETTRISLMDNRAVTPEEYRYFEAADASYETNERAEPLREKRQAFVRQHRQRIIEELLSF